MSSCHWAVEKGKLSRHADHLSIAFSAFFSAEIQKQHVAFTHLPPGRVAEGSCFQMLLLARYLGLDAAVHGARDTGDHFSLKQKGILPLLQWPL